MFHKAGKEEVYITEGEQQVKIFKTYYESSKLFPYTNELKFNTYSYPFVKSSHAIFTKYNHVQ